MNGPMIKKVSSYCIYGTYLRSVPQLNVTIKRFESGDGNKKRKETSGKDHSKLATKSSSNIKRRIFDVLSDKIFHNMAANHKDLSKTGSKEFRGDHKIKLKKIFDNFSRDKSSSNIKTIEVAKPIKNQKPLKVRESEKQNFLKMAKKVALELQIDVAETQEDLLSHHNEITTLTDYSEDMPKLVEDIDEEYNPEDENKPFDFFGPVESMDKLRIFSEKPSQKEREKKEEEEEEREAEAEAEALEKDELEEVVIFDTKGEKGEDVTLKTWEALKAIELQELSYRVPTNYFEELILWTDFGKLHHFPIDNEQDWHEEHCVDFTEHIFLEKYLEPWCPKIGPLRLFMELITSGLSKNPYISVEKKKEHLLWYRDYFFEKSSLLKEVGIHLNVEEKEKTKDEEVVQN